MNNIMLFVSYTCALIFPLVILLLYIIIGDSEGGEGEQNNTE